MHFWDAFWSTAWGALVGALVGAFASWVFALDLHRRDRIARSADQRSADALIQSRAQRDAELQYQNTLNRQVGRLVFAMKRYESELGKDESTTRTTTRQASSQQIYGGAREAALTALLEAEFYTRGDDQRVLRTLRAGVDALPYSRESALAVGVLAQLLVTWRTQNKTVDWVIAGITSWVRTDVR